MFYILNPDRWEFSIYAACVGLVVITALVFYAHGRRKKVRIANILTVSTFIFLTIKTLVHADACSVASISAGPVFFDNVRNVQGYAPPIFNYGMVGLIFDLFMISLLGYIIAKDTLLVETESGSFFIGNMISGFLCILSFLVTLVYYMDMGVLVKDTSNIMFSSGALYFFLIINFIGAFGIVISDRIREYINRDPKVHVIYYD